MSCSDKIQPFRIDHVALLVRHIEHLRRSTFYEFQALDPAEEDKWMTDLYTLCRSAMETTSAAANYWREQYVAVCNLLPVAPIVLRKGEGKPE